MAIQECEMDLLIRFWDETDNVVKARYLGSSFLDMQQQFK